MGTRTITELIDDIDGHPAESTVEFALDGEYFAIDLSRSNRHALVRDLARYMAVARRVNEGGTPTLTYVSTSADPQAVRQWARARGIEVPAGRRIPRDIIDQFHAAGN